MKTTKYLLLLSTAAFVSACSLEQKPAPYEDRGNQQFTRGSSRFEAGQYKNDDVIKSTPISSPSNTYNNNSNYSTNSSDAIDQNEITSQALHEGKAFNNPINNRIGSKTNLVKSDYIDGKKDVVKIASNEEKLEAPLKPIITAQNDVAVSKKTEKDGYVDMSKVSSQKTVDDRLAKIKPIEKPKYEAPVEKAEEKPEPKKAAKLEHASKQEKAPVEKSAESTAVVEVPKKAEVKKEAKADTTPTVTPKIQKIETSAGTIGKSTPAMINSTPSKAEDKDDAKADKSQESAKSDSIQMPPPVTRLGNQNLVKEADKQVDTIKKEEAPATAKTPAVAKAPVSTTAPSVKAEGKKPEAEKTKEAVEDKKTEAKPEKDIAEIKPTVDKSAPQFIKPVDGNVILGFGESKANGKPNDGINIAAPEGAPVKAAAGGEVVYSGNQLQGYGNLVIIRHPEGYLTAYAHMQNLDLKKGEKVNQGQVIGHVGTTGNVEQPQLHFGVRKGREAVDPKDFL